MSRDGLPVSVDIDPEPPDDEPLNPLLAPPPELDSLSLVPPVTWPPDVSPTD